jgi:hypothetical protein
METDWTIPRVAAISLIDWRIVTARESKVAVSSTVVHWFESLHQRAVFAGKRSILEIGPQDITAGPTAVGNFIAGAQPEVEDPHAIAARFIADGVWATHRFYATVGLTDYFGIDLEDPRATFRYDLNRPFSLGRRFDVITNFGTLEHIFSVASVIEATHNHLADGGLALFILPSRGGYNHGFYNIHSNFYHDLARHNRYEIVDLLAVPDIVSQQLLVDKHEKPGDLPPRLTKWYDIANNDPAIPMSPIETFLEERQVFRLALQKVRQRGWWFKRNPEPPIFEYIFAALRKVGDAPFVMPMQSIYAAKREGMPGA